MSLHSSSSSSNSSQTQLVAATDTQPHPPAKSKESPILRSLSKKSQKSLVVSRQEGIVESIELTSLVSADDVCMIDHKSHYVTVQKQQTNRSASPCKDGDVELQKGVSLGRSESERSLMDEGSPDSSDHQPLQPTNKHQESDMDKQPEDMETSQEYSKPSTVSSKKHPMGEDASKSKTSLSDCKYLRLNICYSVLEKCIQICWVLSWLTVCSLLSRYFFTICRKGDPLPQYCY